MCLHCEVRPVLRWIEIAIGGTHSSSVAYCRLRHGDAVLEFAVVIGCAHDADLLRTIHDRFVKRTVFDTIVDFQYTAAATKVIVRFSFVILHVAEDRQYVAVTPSAISELRPNVEVLALASGKDHSVDRTRTAEQLTARH